ncbi:hypothetical protein TWF718_002049 [Orbilia javanica]|uniref:Uncharacterized protein n=1 Tax=Orbilia javanica TaxID=47235 RepID=A0AAN8N1S2_9PEZI
MARYLPEVVKDNGQNHLFKRQMENNPFALKPIVNPQTFNIRITETEEVEDGGDQESGGAQTPRFSDTGSQQGGQAPDQDIFEEEKEQDIEEGGNSQDILEPPSFRGVGLVHALDNIDLGPLESGTNLIDPYAEIEAASEVRDIEQTGAEQLEEIQRSSNLYVEPNSVLGDPENTGRQSVKSEDEEFYDANSPTEEQERIIRETLQEELQAATDQNQGEPINQDGGPAREAVEVEEHAGGVSGLNDAQDGGPVSKPQINISSVTNIDPTYIPQEASRSRRQQGRRVREEEEQKVDPEAAQVQARLRELYGVEPEPDTRKDRSKSPLRRFGDFVVSIPKKGVSSIVNKVTGRGRRGAPAKIEYSQNDPPSPRTVIESDIIEDVIQPLNQQAAIGDINGNNQVVAQPLNLAADTAISISGWGNVGHGVYDAPTIYFGEGDEVDEKEIMKSYYKRRLRK